MQQRTLVALKTIARLALLSFPLAAQAQTPTATINWIDVRQQIDGFGAAAAWTAPSMTDAQADLFFSPTAGIGLSLVRERIPVDGTVEGCVTMQKAVARGAKAWATAWSPPASMKSNGSVNNGGTLLAGSYQTYANYQKAYIQNVQSQCGVTLYAISVQNEPDYATTYESAIWTGQNFHDYILNNLGPTLAAAGLATKIIMPEYSSWNWSLADVTMKDAAAVAYVPIVATHGYGGSPQPYALGQGLGKHLWETEVSDFGKPDASIVSGLTYAIEIHNTMTIANGNAWHYWWLIDGANNPDNEGLTLQDGVTVTKRLYTIGNFSKFIRPGWVRIGGTANPVGGVYVSAYKDLSSGTFAIVAINQNGTAVPLNFVLNGFPAASVTPWVTSASLDLAQQPSISADGGAFSGTLLASSVTTFISKLSSAAVAPPTNLNATVH
ncbi:MAG TPA: glycoside hydrolase [Candidatus Dormibacteraeota bacterium]|nr:glycoside hydrolase [Candidatus Dormibacteraeota bacterium]